MEVFDRSYLVPLFISLFSVVRPTSNGWVSLLASEKTLLFAPYSDLVKKFKRKYLCVAQINRASKRKVSVYDENVKLVGRNFPLF